MRKTEYTLPSPINRTIAIVADLHEFNPEPVLSILASIRPDVIAVPGDLFENHEFGENLGKEDDSLISRLLCRIIHITNRLAGLRWRQKHDVNVAFCNRRSLSSAASSAAFFFSWAS